MNRAFFPILSAALAVSTAALAGGASTKHPEACLSGKCYALDSAEGRAGLRALLSKKLETAKDADDADYPEIDGGPRKKLVQTEIDLLDADSPENRMTVAEIHRSTVLAGADPFPEGFELFAVPYHFVRDLFASPYIRGKSPAKPPLSTIVAREDQADIGGLDFAKGMRSSHPAGFDFKTGVCTYSKKKTSNGTRPGFKVLCDGTKVKVKFKETHSHPFASRVLWALGYAVAPADYVESVNLKYDRRIFTEINDHAPVEADLKLAGIKVKRVTFKPHHDMLKFIDHATAKDGARIETADLAKMIGDDAAEAKIETVTTRGTQLQLDPPKTLIEIGSWSYNDFDHPDNRDLRALALPLAWIGGWDFRQDNNGLALDLSGPKPAFRFMLPDLGSALGEGRSFYFFKDTIEDADGFSKRIARGRHLGRFTTIEKNEAFKKCTRDDARWMLEKMNRISERQLDDALGAAGYAGDEKAKFLKELLRRRDALNRAFR